MEVPATKPKYKLVYNPNQLDQNINPSEIGVITNSASYGPPPRRRFCGSMEDGWRKIGELDM